MATYAALMAEIERLKNEAEQVRKEELKVAIGQIRSLMEQHGITLEDLGATSKKTAGAKKQGEIQYRDESTGNEWTGRGRKPKWLEDYIAQGKSKEDFKIKPAA